MKQPQYMKYLLFICVLGFVASGSTFAAPEGFVPLFNGKNFDGWNQEGGDAKYTIEDGVIVGTSVPKTGNSFLCTAKKYDDFILEVDFKVSSKLNSGIQIRSNVYDEPTVVYIPKDDGSIQEKKIPAGRVHGYQVEIDPSGRAWTGGIYDEARRGWLYNLAGDEKKEAREAFKQNEWNHFRIVCKDDSIKTWLNGVPAANLQDSMTSTGHICLQVHGVGNNEEKIGEQVRWKNIYIKELD